MINGHHRAINPLHRYFLYVTTLSANFDPLPANIKVTDRNCFKPIRSNAGNGVTDEIPGYIQIMRKFNQKRVDHKATKASILLFAGTTVLPEKGKIVRASALYAHYCTRAARAGKHGSRKKIYRMLDKNGYIRRPDKRGDYYENLAFIKGEPS